VCSLRCNSAIRTTAERNTEAVSAARLRNQVVVAYAFLAVMVATALPTPLYPIYEKQLGLSSLDVTAIYGVYAVVVLATLAMFGRVSDHLGRRPVLLMAVAAAALGEVVLLTEPQTAGLYVGRAVIGFAAGLMIGSTTAYLVDLGADNNAGRAHIFAVVANLGGQAVGAVLAGVAAQFLPHPLALPYGVGLILLGPVALLWVLRVPETVLRNDDLRGAFTPGLGALPPQVRSTFRATAATFVAAFALLGFLTALTGSILVQQLHRPGSLTVGLVTFALFAAAAIGQLAVSAATPTRVRAGALALLPAAALLLGAATLARSFLLLLSAVLICGLGVGVNLRLGIGRVLDACPPVKRAQVSSALFVTVYLGASLPTVAAGLMATEANLTTAVLALTGVVLALTLAAAVMNRLSTRAHVLVPAGRSGE